MSTMRKIIFMLSLLIAGNLAMAQDCSVESPDGKLVVELTSGRGNSINISAKKNGAVIMESSPIGMRYSLSSGKSYAAKASSAKHMKENIEAVNYRQKSFVSEYNEIAVNLNGKEKLLVRVFDEGFAYRFVSKFAGKYYVMGELAQYNFPKESKSYLSYSTNKKDPFAMAFQNIYSVDKLSAQDTSNIAFLPVTIDEGGCKVTILESDLENYPGMFLRPDGNGALKAEFAGYPKKMDYYPWRKMSYVAQRENYLLPELGARNFPWRVFAVTDNDCDMPTSNLVYALASPSRIADTGWIKPGKSAWDWWNDWGIRGVDFQPGINTETYKYFADFASAHGLEYIILDEGWYSSKDGDILNSIPEVNLPEIISYAKDRGVGVILWAVFNVVDENLEAVCKKYSEMGVKGLKIDFLDRDDADAVQMAYRIAAKAAKYHLMLDYHGFYKPTGINRTYPNIVNIESVFGMEETKWNENNTDMPLYDVTFPFIRMMAGPVDYTPGAMRNGSRYCYKPVYSQPMSMGTRCHQLASYVVHDSPLTMLADAPSSYCLEPEYTKFVSEIPDSWDCTKVLDGKLGEFIVTARKSGSSWYVGGLSNWDGRNIELSLSFLEPGKLYTATIYRDGRNADKIGEDYLVEQKTVIASDKLMIRMAGGGGFCIRIQ